MKSYRTGNAVLAVGIALLVTALTVCGYGVMRAKTLVERVFTVADAQGELHEEYVSYFTLRAEMFSEQMRTRVRGWQSIAPGEEVSISTQDGELAGMVYPAVRGGEDAAWAVVLGGREKVLDVACMLSLAGYRVLMPELTAHGALDSLGTAEAKHVAPWVNFILAREPDAQIVLFGQDTGAAAALLAAAQGLHEAVRAVAVESAYGSVCERANARMMQALPDAGKIDWMLLELGYRVAFGVSLDAGEVLASVKGIGVPVLLIHGTGDEVVPAWNSEDIAAACGGELLLIEGAAHGMARYVDQARYQTALTQFYEKALN